MSKTPTFTDKINEIRQEFPNAAKALDYLHQQMLPDGELEVSRWKVPKRDIAYLNKAIRKLGSKTLSDLFDGLDPEIADLPAWKEFVYCSPAWSAFIYSTPSGVTDFDVRATVGQAGRVADRFLDRIAFNA